MLQWFGDRMERRTSSKVTIIGGTSKGIREWMIYSTHDGRPQAGDEFRDLDAAVTWKNGQTYIFKGTGFYEYDNFPCGVKDRNPQNTLKKWLGC